MIYRHATGRQTWVFGDLKELMAKATPLRSGDMLAGYRSRMRRGKRRRQDVPGRCSP